MERLLDTNIDSEQMVLADVKYVRTDSDFAKKVVVSLGKYESTNLTPSDIADLRNELCMKCGKYKTAHEGSCQDCRWRNKT